MSNYQEAGGKQKPMRTSVGLRGALSKKILFYILWRIDPLLGKDLETNEETTPVAVQQRSKHASTTIELLFETALCNPLLGSCNIWTTIMETGMFYM
jgi:hypothetical protein